ncbi:MAG: hypothetical protein AABX05_03805 [Nanoarchaeota archaeon]
MNRSLSTLMALSTAGCAYAYLPETSVQEAEPSTIYEGIAISGPVDYTNNIIKALDIVYQKDTQNWQIVKDNLVMIRFSPPSGMHVRTGIYDTDDNKTTSDRYQPLEWVAGEIVHDAWHREYFRRREAYNGMEGERKCMERQNEFFQKIGYPLLDVPLVLSSAYWDARRNW